MIDRRQAIRSALIGIGVASSPKALFNKLVADKKLELQINEVQHDAESYWKLIKSQFLFEDGLLYFNNASLGSSPITVMDATETYRRTLDSFPSKYMWGGWEEQINFVKEQAASLLNANSDEIALIHNTTEGMNVVAASLDLKSGDEVIVGNHEHRTALSPWLYHQARKGIKVVRPELPLIPAEPQELLDVYEKAITPNTKVISMVHMTNTNGMVLPVKQICSLATRRNILTVIDGAQSLGSIPCDMQDIGCDYFTASGHKWLFSPKGIGLFYAKKNKQKLLKPFIANRAYNSEGIAKIDDYNTRNLPDLLGLGAALKFHDMIGLPKMKDRTLSLRKRFITNIESNKDLIVKTPLHPSLSHQIVTVEKEGMDVSVLKDFLYESKKIDVRGMHSHGLNGVRISFAVYHNEADIDTLAEALGEA